MQPGEIKGRVAVVTGGGSGIGFEVAEKLVQEGCVAFITGRREDVLQKAAEQLGCQWVCLDVRDKAEVDSVFDRIGREAGDITILVGNAGVAKFGPSESVTQDEFAAQMNTNVDGLFFTNIAAIRQMKAAGGGDIVNVLSIMSTMGLAETAAYTASKWGALGLTRSLNAEYRADNIRISAVLPGATDTPIWDSAGYQLDPAKMLKSEDVAEGIVFCLKQPASSAIEELQIMPRAGFL